ncbi:MAG TPA: cell division protein ZapE [Alphaproteobacteria bacterium]
MTSDTGEGPLAAYRARLAEGRLRHDPAQALAAEKLESLHRALKGYRPGAEAGGWRARLGLARRPDPAPNGLYIFGGVGRGKSMLMDLFFATAPVEKKRRVHFNAFMLEIHDRLYMGQKAASPRAGVHPLMPLADRIAEEAWLLCFDEFQVTNIADAMILGRLLEALFARGVVIVTTSNSAPDDLYAGGLQRERFLPTIDLIKARLDVLELDGGIDYRRQRIKGTPVYYTPLGPDATAALESMFLYLTDGEVGSPQKIRVQGRELIVPRAARGVAMASFADLCERPLGPADFVALATHFEALVLDGIRVIGPDERNAARRFITLIDELYEHRVNLICAAEAAPEALYPQGDHAAEFRRTVSRLHEMQSEDYLGSPHLT